MKITHLFLDIGGVLLTNGWDRDARRRAAEKFKMDASELEQRHHLSFEIYETGKFSLEQYLNLVVFYKKRSFTRAQFRRFMFAQSKPYPKMLELIVQMKVQYGIKVFVVSNEAREINTYRIKTFRLDRFVDAFISSCYVHVRKPEIQIFQLALDIAQVEPDRVVYIENTEMFIEIAEELGIHGILHKDYLSTCKKLASFGLLPDTRG